VDQPLTPTLSHKWEREQKAAVLASLSRLRERVG